MTQDEKIKASENKAVDVETKQPEQPIQPILKPPDRTIGQMSSEELAFLLEQQYQLIIQSQGNILAIKQILERRVEKVKG